MSSNTQINCEPQHVYPPYPNAEEEINLLDILQILLSQKWLIVGITALSVVLAFGLVLLLPRAYKVEAVLLPPQIGTMEKLNVPNINFTIASENSEKYFFSLTSSEIYRQLLENLRSSNLQRQFFDENKLSQVLTKKGDKRSVDRIFKEEFHSKITVKNPKTKQSEGEFVTVSYEGPDPELAPDWLNRFILMADQETVEVQTRAFSMKVQRKKENVSQQIKSMRATEKSERLDKIAMLEDALNIAEELGLEEQVENNAALQRQPPIDKMGISLNLLDMPLYSRGGNALRAELTSLRNRKNDDPYIEDLRKLQEELVFFSSVAQNVDDVHAMRLDRAAMVNDRPVKPKRKLIVVVGLGVGVLLSVCVALIRNMIVTTQ